MAGFTTERLEEALRVDVVARVEGGAYVSAEPLPRQLKEAESEVGELFSLSRDSLNAGPTSLPTSWIDLGLPEGFESRVTTRSYGSLTVHIAGRADQIAFKLYATTDQGPRSKHFADLKLLSPTGDELLWAARWARTHDPSEPFRDQLVQALAALGIDDAHDL